MKIDLLNLNNVKKAFAIANNAIYFNDSSDYLTASKDKSVMVKFRVVDGKYIYEGCEEL